MDVEEFRALCLAKKGVSEEVPFGPENLVYKVMGKMFALLPLDGVPVQTNLKCDPEWAISLRDEYDGSIYGAYHMNKVHWNSLILDRLPPQLIRELIDHSYELVVAKLTKKLRQELDGLGD